MQNAAATNPPSCPVCHAAADPAQSDFGWLTTSEQPNTVAPAVYLNVKVFLCRACGALFGALNP